MKGLFDANDPKSKLKKVLRRWVQMSAFKSFYGILKTLIQVMPTYVCLKTRMNAGSDLCIFYGISTAELFHWIDTIGFQKFRGAFGKYSRSYGDNNSFFMVWAIFRASFKKAPESFEIWLSFPSEYFWILAILQGLVCSRGAVAGIQDYSVSFLFCFRAANKLRKHWVFKMQGQLIGSHSPNPSKILL